MTIEIPVIPKLPATGLCESCAVANECPMPDMLDEHLSLVKMHDTWWYEDVDPGSWDEFSIDLPAFTGDVVEWCPMYEN